MGIAQIALDRPPSVKRAWLKAEESLEALTQAQLPGDERSNERNMDGHLPSVPNLMLEDTVIKGQHGQCRNMALHANTITLTTSVASHKGSGGPRAL